jgi:hypothetical protein
MTKSIGKPVCSPCTEKPEPDNPEPKRGVFTFGEGFAVQIVACMEDV